MTAPPPAAPAGLRARIATLTCLTMAAGTVAGPTIGILASVLRDEFDLSRGEVGRLAAVYALVGAAASPLAGRLADHIGGRRTMVLTGLAGSLSFLLFGAATAYWMLIVMAVVSGLPNGASNPGTNRLIVTFVPGDQRGTVTGVKQSGVQLGTFLSGVTLPPAVNAFGLRTSLLAVAVLLLAVPIGIMLTVPSDVAPRGETHAPSATERLPDAVWWLTAYAFLMGAGSGAAFAFNALYAEERLGFSNQAAGLLVGLSGLAALVCRVLFSRLSQRSSHFAVPLTRLAVGAIAALIVIAAAPWLGGWALWVGVLAGGTTMGSWNSVVMLATMASTEPGAAGRAAGRVLMGFLGGLGLVPPAFGAVVDATGSYLTGWIAIIVAAVAAAVSMQVWLRRDLSSARGAPAAG